MIALAYLATVAIGLVVLAAALRRRPAPARPTPPVSGPAAAPLATEAEIRLILAAAAQLAARLTPAA
ncbi:hypothetical protein OG460_31350 [Streptomyces albidoflavus]